MLTNTKFNKYQNNLDARIGFIVKIDDGTNQWYLGDIEISGFSEGHVYNLLEPGSVSINEGFDFTTKQWQVSDVSVRFSNRKYKRDSSQNWISLSDEIGDIAKDGAELTIYLLVGETATGLTDCLTRYVGKIVSDPSYDVDRITVESIDLGTVKNINLPATKVSTVYPGALKESLEKRIPLVYGKFTKTFVKSTDFGLAVSVKITNERFALHVVADHINNSMTEVFGQIGSMPEPYIFDNATKTADDGGRATVQIVRNSGDPEIDATAYLYPVANYVGDYSLGGLYLEFTDDPNEITDNLSNVSNHSNDDYATVRDALDDGNNMNIQVFLVFEDYSLDSNADNEIGVITGDATDDILFQIVANIFPGVTWSSVPKLTLIYNDGTQTGAGQGNVTLSDTVFSSIEVDVLADPPDWLDKIIWHLYSGHSDGTSGSFPIIFLIEGQTANSTGDSIANNDDILKIFQARLKVGFHANTWDQVLCACEGRKYDTWISSRSSNYSSGDLIEDPAGIIESILREELGYGNDDIDMPSFIDAENTSVTARINIHDGNSADAMDIIRQITEQSTFSFVITSAGKAKLIPLNETLTTVRTIPWSHIVKNGLKPFRTVVTANGIKAKSTWQQEYEAYRDEDTILNTTSQTAIGPRNFNAQWSQLSGTSVTHVANHYVRSRDGSASDGDGIWAKKQNGFVLTTKRFTNADLEEGDVIDLDALTVDPNLLCYGESWSSKEFLVTKLTQNNKTTRIIAIEL